MLAAMLIQTWLEEARLGANQDLSSALMLLSAVWGRSGIFTS